MQQKRAKKGGGGGAGQTLSCKHPSTVEAILARFFSLGNAMPFNSRSTRTKGESEEKGGEVRRKGGDLLAYLHAPSLFFFFFFFFLLLLLFSSSFFFFFFFFFDFIVIFMVTIMQWAGLSGRVWLVCGVGPRESEPVYYVLHGRGHRVCARLPLLGVSAPQVLCHGQEAPRQPCPGRAGRVAQLPAAELAQLPAPGHEKLEHHVLFALEPRAGTKR